MILFIIFACLIHNSQTIGEPMNEIIGHTANATIETTKAVYAYNKGLVSEAYPHYRKLQALCSLLDHLNDLLEWEYKLQYERCPNTGAYVDNEEALEELGYVIYRIQGQVDAAEITLAAAIDSK